MKWWGWIFLAIFTFLLLSRAKEVAAVISSVGTMGLGTVGALQGRHVDLNGAASTVSLGGVEGVSK